MEREGARGKICLDEMRPNIIFTTSKTMFEKIEHKKVYVKANAFAIDTFFQVWRDSSRDKKSARTVPMQERYNNDGLVIHTEKYDNV